MYNVIGVRVCTFAFLDTGPFCLIIMCANVKMSKLLQCYGLVAERGWGGGWGEECWREKK